jgi:hypothetical protein
VGELSEELKELPKRALLASAFITYLAQAPEDIRRNFMNSWSEALGVQHFDCRRFLSTESEQLIWKSEGLPSDELSMENALVILQVILFSKYASHALIIIMLDENIFNFSFYSKMLNCVYDLVYIQYIYILT